MSKHTPGPWEVRPSSNPKNGTLWRDIVSMGTPFTPSYVGEGLEHDAHLMAKAPELLSALRDLLTLAAEQAPALIEDHDADMNDPGELPHTPECVICSARALLTSLEA
jgi:hypothetical protein